MNLRAEAASGVVWTAAERWGGQLLGLAVFLALARLLDSRAFGLVSLAGLHVSFVQMFVQQGLGTAIVQRSELRLAHLDAAFWMSMGAAVALAGLTVGFREWIAGQLGDVAAADVLGVLAVTLPMAAASVVPSAILTRQMRFRSLAVRSTIAATAGGIVGLTAALWNAGVWALVAQQMVTLAVGVACLWTNVSWRPGNRTTGEAFRGLALFGAGVMGNDVLWFLSQRIDQVVIGRGLGTEALGVYAVAMRVLTLGIEVVTGPAQSVALPLFSRIQHDRTHLARVYVRSITLICALGFPAFVGLALVAPRLVPVALGLKWQPAILPLQILCCAGVLRVVQTFVHPMFMALGRPVTYTLTFALLAGTNTVGSLLAVGGGVEAVAWAVAVAYGVTGVANFAVLGRYVGVGVSGIVRPLAPIGVACVGMAAVVVGIDLVLSGHLHDAAVLALQCVGGAVVYGAVLSVVSRSLWADLLKTAGALRGKRGDLSAMREPTT